MAADYTITITVDANNKIDVDDPLKSVYPGETVDWYCATHDYAVLFLHGTTPDDYGKKFMSKRGGNNTSKIKAKSLNGGVGAFEYKVLACVGGTKPIAILDPHIIIDDTGGGGGGAKKKARRKSTRKKAKTK